MSAFDPKRTCDLFQFLNLTVRLRLLSSGVSVRRREFTKLIGRACRLLHGPNKPSGCGGPVYSSTRSVMRTLTPTLRLSVIAKTGLDRGAKRPDRRPQH